jgi:hypothetical protein
MKELIKPTKKESTYTDEDVRGLCAELTTCGVTFKCRSVQSADMDDDEILF